MNRGLYLCIRLTAKPWFFFPKNDILIKSKKRCFEEWLKGSCQAVLAGLASWRVAPVSCTGLKGRHTEFPALQPLFLVLSSFNKGPFICASCWVSQMIESVLSLGLRNLQGYLTLLWVIETNRREEQIRTKDLSNRESHPWNFRTVSPVPPGEPGYTLCPSDFTSSWQHRDSALRVVLSISLFSSHPFFILVVDTAHRFHLTYLLFCFMLYQVAAFPWSSIL